MQVVAFMSRGFNHDYGPIGLKKYPSFIYDSIAKDYTAQEMPSFVLTGGSQIHLGLTGIATPRKDRVRTPIRCSMDIVGSSSDAEAILNVLGNFLSSIRKVGALSELLESVVGKHINDWDVVEQRNGEEATKAVESLGEKLRSLPKAKMGSNIKEALEGLLRGDKDAPQIACKLSYVHDTKSDTVEDLKKTLDGTRYSKVMIFPGGD